MVNDDNVSCVVYEQIRYKVGPEVTERLGRYYHFVLKNGDVAYQNMRDSLRRILMCEKNVELDMKNAQSKLLLYKYPDSPQLLRYIADREELLQEAMNAVRCTSSAEKKLFIRLLFGGKIKAWKEEHMISKQLSRFMLRASNRDA